jgi:acyl transferase domain-containing protein/acyl carrier protein/NAD(P)-dependent dehydrogenase (short-subunit alcohol dehydrogenase family)/3-hydroxymyristoyl/3-hydroxydecanoyl-(acyl carrier protein) dehydratase
MPTNNITDIERKVLDIVSEKTGYPPDMLELDLDMEADLGIDTVKQVELFAAIREQYELDTEEGVNLSDYPTIRNVVDFIANRIGVERGPEPANAVSIENETRVEGPPKNDISERVLEIVAGKTGYPPDMLELDLDMEADLGIDTVKQVELFAAIREEYDLPSQEGVNLSEYPTIGSVVNFIAERVGAVETGEPIKAKPEEKFEASIPETFTEENMSGAESEELSIFPSAPEEFFEDYYKSKFEPIAVIGMGCIMPDSPTIDTFWNNILSKKDSIREISDDRWDKDIFYDPDPTALNKTYSKIGAFVEGFEFNPLSFRIPPTTVAHVDPIQLWTLAATKQAWEDSGYHDKDLDRTRIAVIIANAQGGEYRDINNNRIHLQEFIKAADENGLFSNIPEKEKTDIIKKMEKKFSMGLPPVNEDTMPGELSNIVAARVASVFNFKGANFTTDAACASSLAAIDTAIKGLWARDYDMVITGGVDRTMNPPTYIKFCKIGALSKDGSRPFDAGANGFVMGEGAGILVMKRLSDAMEDRDRIYAVIRGIGSSSDGKGKGITAPNPPGQLQAIEMAHDKAGYGPETVTLIEAHGTSTVVGDAVELQTLADIWSKCNLGKGSVGIGSIKSQIGHMKSAAGVAGMIKMILALNKKIISPTINYRVPNNQIDLGKTPLYVATEQKPWKRPIINGREYPLRGGVSSFGFGGSNFHITLEEYTGQYPVSISQVQLPHARKTPNVDSITRTSAADVQEYIPSDFDLDEYLENKEYLEGTMLSLSSANLKELKKMVLDVRGELEREKSLAGFRLSEFTHNINTHLGPVNNNGYRLSIASPSPEDLLAKLNLSLEHLENRDRMFVLETRGIFYNDPESINEIKSGDGDVPRVGYIFPGQGSQYLNMLRDLGEKYRVVKETFDESDIIMTGINGRPLTDIIFSDDGEDQDIVKGKIADLRKTEITQPAMITGDIALYRLLDQFGVKPAAVAGHSLGEYGALVASGVMDFESALRAAAARGREMANVHIDDKGKMASIGADEMKVQEALDSIEGYAIVANKNSYRENVISGESQAVVDAVEKLKESGVNCIMLPVSHAFHSNIVAPAKKPLRRFLSNIPIHAPKIPTLTNVHGGLYPTGENAPEEIRDILKEQVAGAVEWVKEMETMYNELGVKVFVEVGSKRALTISVKNIFSERPHRAILTNHPKKGGIQSFNEALAALSSCGVPIKQYNPSDNGSLFTTKFISAGRAMEARKSGAQTEIRPRMRKSVERFAPPFQMTNRIGTPEIEEYIELGRKAKSLNLYLDRIVITGAGLGLPGKFKKVFDEKNADLILDGVNLIDTIDKEYRKKFLDKNIVKLFKASNGQAHFERIEDDSHVIKLAGQMGRFDLHKEYGIEKELVKALDISSMLAIAAGLEAMRDAGIPLVKKYNRTSTGNYLPGNWELPEEMQEDTAIIFSTTFPGYDKLLKLTSEYYMDKYGPKAKRELLNLYASLINRVEDDSIKEELSDRFASLYSDLSSGLDEMPVYEFNRKFMLNVLSLGHAQFAQHINARGPNIHNNSACATTTQAVGMAEDLLRMGRCRRVVIISGDAPTANYNMEWLVTSLLANGAATTEGHLEEAALPFDKRRKGLIVGMGAAGMVLERAEDVANRGMDPIVELMGSYMANSAYHATRLDTKHVASEMNHFFERIERRYGFRRESLVDELVFISHETYTPARGGSSNAEKDALEGTFGEDYKKILVTNTKGFTGHAFGCGIEDVIAIRLLQKGKIPPIANYKVPDPYLEGLRLSKGERKYYKYALRFSAGFGSQIAMTLTKIVNTDEFRIIDKDTYDGWLHQISRQRAAKIEVVNKTLRIADDLSRANGNAISQIPAVAPKVAAAPTPVPLVSSSPSPSQPSITPSTPQGGIEKTVIAIVGEKTGYPTDMLELDLDMEADLGIDTVKQVELFGAILEHYGLEQEEGVNLSEYSTIGSVVGYIAGRLGESYQVKPEETVREVGIVKSGLEQVVISIVSEKTGYPPDMLEADLDMEADLGIDTVKQVELFAAIREHYKLEQEEGVNLSNYSTIGSVVQYIAGRLGEEIPDTVTKIIAGEKGAGGVSPRSDHTATTAGVSGTGPSGIERVVIDIVSEKTGYPPDMLELDLDMEADLGIDTVKQVELFAAIREHYSLEQEEGVNLSEYTTIGSVAQYIAGRVASDDVPSAKGTGETVMDDPAPCDEVEEPELVGEARDLRRYLTRYVPKSLNDEVNLDFKGLNLIIVQDEKGVGKEIKKMLKKEGANVIDFLYSDKKKLKKGSYSFDLSDYEMQREVLEKVNSDFGPVGGVIYLLGLDSEPDIDKMDFIEWKTATKKKVKSLFAVAKATITDLKESSANGAFFISAVEMGGSFGVEGDGTYKTPIVGGITGFTKALGKEMEEVKVKCVDIGKLSSPGKASKLILNEIRHGDLRLEVCYKLGVRKIAQMYHKAVDREKEPNLEITGDWVFVIPGGGFGITAEIAKDLAAHFKPTLILLDIVEMPDNIEKLAALDENGLKELKNKIFREMKQGGERATPVMVEREFKKYTMPRTIYNNMKEMEQMGATVEFFTSDVTDHNRINEVISKVRKKYGRIDGIIHAAGLEISKLITAKPPEQFALVFDVKANGAFNLFESTKKDNVKAFVTFSSVAGRFGNIGQVDYSAANDLLNKYMDLNQLRYGKKCKSISTNWTGWRGVGMATRGSLLKIFDDAGVTLIPLEYGKKKVREELLYSGPENEVTIAGKVAFLDADKIILPDGQSIESWDLQQMIDEHRPEYTLIDRGDHHEPEKKIILAKKLDTKVDLYLSDHSIAGTPYLPGVMGVEVFAQTSRLMFPELYPVEIDEIVFKMPIKLLRNRPLEVRIIGEAAKVSKKKAVINVTVESDFLNPQGLKMGDPRIHFTGTVTMKSKLPKAVKGKGGKIPKGEVIDFDGIYSRFFHGPTFQVLGSVADLGKKIKKNAVGWGRFREPVGDFFSFTDKYHFFSGPMFREFGFQTCGMFDMYHRDNLSLPNGIKRIELFEVPKKSKKFISRIVYRGETGDDPMKVTHFDVEIMDEKGNVIDRMTDYEMINTGKVPDEKKFG